MAEYVVEVRCNHCMKTFQEIDVEVITVNGDELEACPYCMQTDALMDLYGEDKDGEE